MSELEIVRLEFAVWHGDHSVVWELQVTIDREQEEQTRTVWERCGADEFIGETLLQAQAVLERYALGVLRSHGIQAQLDLDG